MNWTFEKLMDLATAYWDAAVLAAAAELGVFDVFDENGASAERISLETRASTPHVARLLDALTALEVLEKEGDLYRLAPGADAYLSRSSPTCLLDALAFNSDLYPLWGNLAASVREGKPVLPPSTHLGADESRTRHFVLGMHSRALAVASSLLPHLDVAEEGPLLDVASGPGTFSRLLAEEKQGLSITQFDLPPVLAVARELAEASPASDRISYVDGDYRKAELPRGFRTVLLSGAIHQEDPESAGSVLAKIFRSLQPGGRVWIVDMMLGSDGVRPKFSALFSLNMMLTSRAGRVFTDLEISSMLEQNGFVGPACTRLEDGPYWIVNARRP
ncbi:MAG: methyltransferase domain-containing protein [Lentisphaerae bacterium]|nr:methyltransferase domain-containing protein [Lentisphaerota bacterium]